MKAFYRIICLLFVINSGMCVKRHSTNLIQNYLKIFKNGNHHVISARIKSQSSNKFISFDLDSDVISANTTKVQAFRHKYGMFYLLNSEL